MTVVMHTLFLQHFQTLHYGNHLNIVIKNTYYPTAEGYRKKGEYLVMIPFYLLQETMKMIRKHKYTKFHL